MVRIRMDLRISNPALLPLGHAAFTTNNRCFQPTNQLVSHSTSRPATLPTSLLINHPIVLLSGETGFKSSSLRLDGLMVPNLFPKCFVYISQLVSDQPVELFYRFLFMPHYNCVYPIKLLLFGYQPNSSTYSIT